VSRPARLVATINRRARLAGSFAGSPGDAWLAARMAGWRLMLPMLKRRLPLPRLVRIMWSKSRSRPSAPEREARIAELARVVFRSRHSSRSGNCLERSLVLCRYLSRAGADPELLVGVRRGEEEIRGHAWVALRGAPVEEPPDNLDGVVQVVAFRGEGPGRHSHGASGELRAAP
jgi:Transglutaminase-like superfamily